MSRELSAEHEQIWGAFEKEVNDLVDGGDLNQAVERLTAAISSMGSDEAMVLLRAKALSRRAELKLDLDDGEGALTDARRAISMGAEGAATYGAAGWAAYHLDKPEAGREYFDQALQLDSEEASLLIGRALVLMELEEFELAKADLNKAHHQDREDREVLALLGELEMRSGNLESARKHLEAAVELAPEPEVALMLARVRYVSGDMTGALSIIDEAIDDDDDLALEALLFRSFLRAQHGQIRQARSDAIRASNLFPDEAFAFVQLANVELAAEKVSMVQRAAERAVLLDPSLPDSYMARGAAYQMMGMEEEAKKDFDRAQRAPLELPLFLLGPAYEAIGAANPFAGAGASLFDLFGEAGAGGFDPSSFASAFKDLGAGFGGFGGGFGGGGEEKEGEPGKKSAGKGPIPGMDPMGMLNQIFDDSGNVKGSLKPIFEMALKNAPKIMKNMPPGLLAGMDPEELERLQQGEVSSEEIEERMKEFYRMMQSGSSPSEEDED